MNEAEELPTATLCYEITEDKFQDPNVVKVVTDLRGVALYFSRSPIPSLVRIADSGLRDGETVYGYKHLGLYAYRRESLEAFVRLDPSSLEQREKLEQLRFLEAGVPVAICTDNTTVSATEV